MALTDIQAVRVKTSDRPAIIREEWLADGETIDIKLQNNTVLANPAPRVWREGSLIFSPGDYTIDLTYGILHLATLPIAGTNFDYEYYAVVFSDEEIQHFLSEATGNTTLAAAFVLLAWSA